MKEQNPTRKDESIKTDNEICEMCAKESEEPEKNIEQEETGCCCHCKTTARSQDAVSYTHLDVYKRQQIKSI